MKGISLFATRDVQIGCRVLSSEWKSNPANRSRVVNPIKRTMKFRVTSYTFQVSGLASDTWWVIVQVYIKA